MSQSKRLIIMAAGTGGHIFPGLAIARAMQQKGWIVTWLGTEHGMETQIVPKNNLELDRIDFSGMRGKGLAKMISGGFKLIFSVLACMRIFKQRKPDLIVGMGGYVTVPGGFACKTLGLPLVIVNADAGLLLSNKALLPVAKKILFGFPPTDGEMPSHAVLTGNPIRSEITALPSPKERYHNREGTLNLLIVGGSLGAKVINDCVPYALSLLSLNERPNVVHQTGRDHIQAVKKTYQELGVKANVVEFIDDMASQYAKADLVLCRAGAITVSELTAVGVASILVPFVASSTSHQKNNAEYMAKNQAATYLPQGELNPEKLAAILRQMNRNKCLEQAEVAYELGKRNANDHIVQELEAVAHAKG